MEPAVTPTSYETRNGKITSPGKFEGQPAYAPFFYDLWNAGFADYDFGNGATFRLTAKEHETFPELVGVATVAIEEDDQGFVAVWPLPEDAEAP